MNHNFLIQGWHYIHLIVILVVSSSSILVSYNNLIDSYKILIYYYWILLSIWKPPTKRYRSRLSPSISMEFWSCSKRRSRSVTGDASDCDVSGSGAKDMGEGDASSAMAGEVAGVSRFTKVGSPPLLVNITTVYGTSNSIHGVYKHTFNWGA